MFGQQKRGKNPKVSRFQADTTVTKQRCWVVFQEDMGRTGEHVTCLSLLNLFELWERERRVTSYRCRGYGDEMKVVREECKERSVGNTSVWGWRRQWHPTPVLLPGNSHGRRSLVGCSPWGR